MTTPSVSEPIRRDTPGGTAALTARGVEKRYGGVRALRNVDLVVPEHAIIGLIGPNGAGKSTLLKSLCGYVVPDAGTVDLGSRSLRGWTPAQRARAGLVTTFQHATPISGLSVRDNVLVGMTEDHVGGLLAALFGMPGYRSSEREQVARAGELLRSFGLDRLAGLPAESLSFGQLRLLEIARAVATRPRVLLLDEPAAGLNRVEIDQMATAIRRLRDENDMSVLVVDHDVPFVFGISDRITAMNFGEVIAEGPPGEIKDDEAVRSAYLGAESDADPTDKSGEQR